MAATAKKKDAGVHPSETHAFSAETGKVLQLMIHSLYTNKDIFLRELISNASDACDKLRYQALTEGDLLGDDAELKITVRSDEKDNTVEIIDNGIGMNREDMVANLGTIARSGTLEFLSQIASGKGDTSLIGQFGVGFYSSFMVADKVEVRSRKAGEEKGYLWTSDGAGEYTIAEADEPLPRGTAVKVFLKADEKQYADKFRIRHIIQTYSDHIGFPIWQEGGEEDATEQVNEGSALWARAKSDITPEQYKEFYHHVSHSPDEPFLTLHNKVEGTLSYTNLLFIPSLKPLDLFHPERRRRVKLYVKKVFITEENAEIVPHYLRFLRGVIDSEDLPLNISRETLQDNPLLKKIRESVTSRVLNDLKKKAEKEPEEYTKFWANFGAVIKEGLCESVAPRDKLLEVCRFHSLLQDRLISLEEYVAQMKEGQENIFFLTGDDIETMRGNPLLEGFRDRGIDVLMLTDHVDDFWVNVVPEFKGKTLKSITRSNIDLNTIAPAAEKTETESKKEKKTWDVSQLLAHMKSVYGAEVKDVRTTSKLSGTPACLAVDEGDIDMRMERFLLEHRQLRHRAAKVLEVNASHPLIQSLSKKVEQGEKGSEVDDLILLLLDQARIVEGEPVGDAAAFAARLSRFMQKGLTGT